MSTVKLNISITEAELKEVNQNLPLLRNKITTDDHKQIQETVFDSLSDKDGAPQIGDLVISSFSYDDSQNIGKFRLTFHIDRQFCCSDTSSCQSDYIDFAFIYTADILVATGHFMSWDIEN